MNITVPSKYSTLVQGYIADSIIQSILVGSILIMFILTVEFIPFRKSKLFLHHLYKVLLTALLGFSFFGKLLIPIHLDNHFIKTYVGYSQYNWMYWINLFWVAGVTLLSCKWFVTKYFLDNLIQTSDRNFPGFWFELLKRCKDKVDTSSQLILAHSDKIQSAFVTGVIKPIIIFPTSWINNLSEKEAEYILIHEMSHLKSKDHYFNAICSFAEIVLFFNPAVYFIINRIKLQREICADSFVLKQLKTPIEYASLLVKIGEISIPKSSIAFGSIKAQLTVRIKEILDLHQPKVNHSRVVVLSVLSIFFSLNFFQRNPPKSENLPELVCNQNAVCPEKEIKFNEVQNISILKVRSIKKQPAIQLPSSPNLIIEQDENQEGDQAFLDIDLKDSLFKGNAWKFRLDKDSYTITNSQDSSNIILVINSGKEREASTNSFVKRILSNSRNFMEKDWKEQYPNSSSIIKYILIKDQSKTILSYSNMQQSMYQISTIN